MRIAALEADLTALRRGMVQHLTAVGRITTAAQRLDAVCFANRFTGNADGQRTPLQEIQVASEILDALTARIAESPAAAEPLALAGRISAVVAALAALGRALTDIEQASETAIGLQDRPAHPIRDIPEGAPLDQLAASAAAISDAEAAVIRLKGMIKALAAMLKEAEAAVPVVDTEKIAAELSSELNRTQAEASGLRVAIAETQRELAGQLAQLQGEAAAAQADLESAIEARHADLAEIRGLASEVLALVAGDAVARADDDTEITLQVLRDVLGDATSSADAVCSAAEATLVAWQRLRNRHTAMLTSRVDASSAELDRTRHIAEESRRESDRLGKEAERLTARITELEQTAAATVQERDRARAELAKLRGDAGNLTEALAQAGAARASAEKALAASEVERERARQALARIQTERESDARRAQEHLDQITARMSESSRSHGELKQIHARLAADHDRLSGELAELRGRKADPSATAAWNRRVVELGETAETARTSAQAAEAEATRLRDTLSATETQLARSQERERRMESLLKEARAAVTSALAKNRP